jgi:SAM-dependent methyltransferase
MVPHGAIYEQAALYELAFSYRDHAVECVCLRDIYERRRGRPPRSFLELAAGPAGHAFEMLSAGLDVLALDLAPDMASYVSRKAKARGVILPYTVANMTEFPPLGTFDLAACLLCSASYLLTDEQVLSHFRSVRASLANGGMYVLELTHPSELVGALKSQSTWTMRDGAGELQVEWRGDPAAADDRIWQAEVSLVYRPFDGSSPFSVEDQARQRGFTRAEVVTLAQRSGFTVEATLGGFDENIELDSPRATRMIVVLGAQAARLTESK